MHWLGRLAIALHRRPEDTRGLTGFASVWGKWFLLSIVILPLGGLAVVFFRQSLDFQRASHPEVPIPRDRWRVLYRTQTPDEHCRLVPPQLKNCLASPENPALWNSEFRREDPQHTSRVARQQGSEFWLGTVIPKNDLRRAHAAGASRLIIGWLNAGHEVWLDGERVFAAQYKDIHFPIIVGVPVSRLIENRDLHVAIKMVHDAGSMFPDMLGSFRQEGLATSAQANKYMRAEVFEEYSRVWFFFGVYFVLGALFLMLWILDTRKQECAYLAIYSLFQALIQAMNGDFVPELMDLHLWNRVTLIVGVYEGGFALFLGLAFARFRRAFFVFGVPLFLVSGWVVFYLVRDPVTAANLSAYLSAKMVPRGYLLGAMACFLQSFWLEERRSSKGVFLLRSRRLLLFGIGLAGIGIGYALQDTQITYATYMMWPRFLNIVLVLYLSMVVLRDYREQEKIIERSPISTYHRRAVLPERLSGVLLVIDMKRSEFLIRAGSKLGNSGELVNTGLSHMWAAVAALEGTVLQTEGDALTVFFDNDAKGNAMLRAVEAVEKVALNLEHFTEQLIGQQYVPGDFPLLQFRASITQGDIRPIWTEIRGNRYAGWIAAGQTNSFLEAARLLELEPQLDPTRERSLVVMHESTAAMLDDRTSINRLPWVVRNSSMMAKHGDTYHVAALAVGGVRFGYEQAVSIL